MLIGLWKTRGGKYTKTTPINRETIKIVVTTIAKSHPLYTKTITVLGYCRLGEKITLNIAHTVLYGSSLVTTSNIGEYTNLEEWWDDLVSDLVFVLLFLALVESLSTRDGCNDIHH